MIKKVFGKKLSRGRPAREALFAGLIRSLVLKGKIVTTKAKSKAIHGQIQRYLHLVGKGTLEIRRRILADLKNDKETTKALFDKKFISVKIVSLPQRKGDNAPTVRMELVEEVKKTKDENIPTKGK